VYVGNLSYDVKYRDMIEFMRGGGWGRFSSWSFLVFFLGCGGCGGSSSSSSSGGGSSEVTSSLSRCEGQGLDTADELWGSLVSFSRFRWAMVRCRMVELIVGTISW
jgi:hypothetical protein